MKDKPKSVVILGPTASGKSDLAISLARKFNGEIISADSRQVYKGMDIGTGKISKREQRMVRHHLLDVISPKKEFTVADFKHLGQKAINNIVSREKLPIIVGGTGFYIDALVKGIVLPEVPPNKKLRAELVKQSAEQLFKRLEKLDQERAKNIDPHNKRRLIRALEIIKTTGKPVPKLLSNINYKILWLGLKPKNTKSRIKVRLEKRLRQGMVREVKNLLRSGVSRKRLYSFGLEYRWISEYLAGKINYVEMKNGLLKAIIKYSKHQMTWFKRNKEIYWINPSADGQREAERLISDFVRPPTESPIHRRRPIGLADRGSPPRREA